MKPFGLRKFLKTTNADLKFAKQFNEKYGKTSMTIIANRLIGVY